MCLGGVRTAELNCPLLVSSGLKLSVQKLFSQLYVGLLVSTKTLILVAYKPFQPLPRASLLALHSNP